MLAKNHPTFFITLLKIGTLLSIPILIFVGCVYLGAWGNIPDSDQIAKIAIQQPSKVYDFRGKLITIFQKYNQKPVLFDSLPKHLIDALIATEDIRFYEHHGIDSKSLGRVFFKTILLNDERSGGGSTLSQQIVKNLYGRKDHGWLTIPIAKTKEMIIAHRLENIYSKEKILDIYLSIVPFSGNTYGIESAANKFFNKSATQLTLNESATLIGTLKATHSYHPKLFPSQSIMRRNTVLDQMLKYGFLDDTTHKIQCAAGITINVATRKDTVGIAPHFIKKLEQRLLNWCQINSTNGRNFNLYTSGLQIHTTLDLKMQQLAEQSAVEHMSSLQQQFEREYRWQAPWSDNHTIFKSYVKKLPTYRILKKEGQHHETILTTLSKDKTLDSLRNTVKLLNLGMIGISPKTGAVKTWIGGIDYNQFKYDHLDSKRQVGSTFKPIVYAAALDRGLDPCDHISGKEVSYNNLGNWNPSNAGQQRHDTLRYSMSGALSNSLNAVSVKILERTGINKVVSLSRKLNIKSDLPKVPSIALGTSQHTIPELAGAYAAFVNKGTPVQPYFLDRIENSEGQIMDYFGPSAIQQRAMKLDTQEMMLEMLQRVSDQGTARPLRYAYGLKNDIGGKTGTTQSNKDAWFVGVMPELVTVTWVGHDDHRIGFKRTHTGQGSNAALPLTALLLQNMNKDTTFSTITEARFPTPSNRILNKLDCAISIPDYDRYSYLFPEELEGIEKRSYNYRSY